MCKNKQENGPQLNAVEQENDSDDGQDTHTYFASVEIGNVVKNQQSTKSLVNVLIAGREVKLKADTYAEATVIPYHLFKSITNKPLQNIH
jgi:hypothetical protein